VLYNEVSSSCHSCFVEKKCNSCIISSLVEYLTPFDFLNFNLIKWKDVLFSILNFANEETRVKFISVSRAHAKLLTSEVSFKWRNVRLHIENGIYFSPDININVNSTRTSVDTDADASTNFCWKQLFLHNYPKRNLWTAAARNNCHRATRTPQDPHYVRDKTVHTFQLTVSARFKPKGMDHASTNTNQEHQRKISLPLHQRLALIRMNRNITSQREAFKVLMHQGGWFGDMLQKLQAGEEKNDMLDYDADENNENNKDEDNNMSHTSSPSISGGVHLIDTVSNAAILVDRTKGLRRFEFDRVFCDKSTQVTLYHQTTMPLIAEFINGYNATCLVYGQTGSGKTYSMFGNQESFKEMMTMEGTLFNKIEVPESFGLVPRAVKEIFDALEYRKSHLALNIDAKVSLSYIEIYGDEISDLLKKGATCGQSRVAAQRYVLDGSSEVPVESLHDTLHLLDEGEKQKRKAATAMNARSSRAHTLFILTLRQECIDTGVSATSRLFLADLGGSEQIKRSQPTVHNGGEEVDQEQEKQRVKEAVNINLGLLALKQCVEGLRKKKHVPYGDSKLTMMLSTGLGGDSKTSVIVCGSQEESHGPETIAAMKFAQTCRGIYNTVKTNVNMLETLLKSINDRIARCEQNIRDHERWVEVDDARFNDDGILIEVRKKTVVAGADSYRCELASLIRQKSELTGESSDEFLYGIPTSVEGFGDFHQYTSEANRISAN